MNSKSVRLINHFLLFISSCNILGILLYWRSISIDKVSSSRSLLQATRPKAAFQTFIHRFERNHDLDMSIGFIFTPDQNVNILYANFKYILQSINEPMNMFVCYDINSSLSSDHMYLLNFAIHVTVAENSLSTCYEKFVEKYPCPRHVAVFEPGAAFTEKTYHHLQKLKDAVDGEKIVHVARNGDFVEPIMTLFLFTLAITVFTTVVLGLESIQPDIILGQMYQQAKGKTVSYKIYRVAIAFLFAVGAICVLRNGTTNFVESAISQTQLAVFPFYAFDQDVSGKVYLCDNSETSSIVSSSIYPLIRTVAISLK